MRIGAVMKISLGSLYFIKQNFYSFVKIIFWINSKNLFYKSIFEFFYYRANNSQ